MSETSDSGLVDATATPGEATTAAAPAKKPGRTLLQLFFAVAWLAFVIAGWLVLWWVAVAYPGGWEALWTWVRDQTLVAQILMWLLLLPYMMALWAWNTSWAEWLRVAVVASVAAGSILASIPWPKR